MLLSMHVKNLALIDEAEVDFLEGLNILTGETGAGKSIIIGSINLALGEKVPKEMIRENAEYALVELIFKVEQEQQKRLLEQMDISLEDDILIMSRKITANRSIGKINSESVSALKMKEAAALLIDIHGQHEHQSLLHTKKHLEILDDYAKEYLSGKKEEMEEAYHAYQTLLTEREQVVMDDAKRARELSFLEYEREEIDKAELKAGEDENLEAQYKKMLNSKKIIEAAAKAYSFIEDHENGASEQISRALREMGQAIHYDEKMAVLNDQLIEIDGLLNDFTRELSTCMADAEFHDDAFHEIENRLNEINHLKTKYGDSIEAILKNREEKEKQYEKWKDYEQYLKQLDSRLHTAEEKLQEMSEAVSKIRQKHAKKLVKQVKESLIDLNFLDVKFTMDFKTANRYSANGTDIAEFMISTNPGEPQRQLKSVASGGELSRIMLALKTVLAENDAIETLIFDEIDTGISGRTAQMVAEKMNVIGKNHQVICITHLPQIAAMADSHFLIEKSVVNESTISTIDNLSMEDSTRELARMLGGVKITQTVLESAKEMKELAQSVKKNELKPSK
ncbi:DNA repair protein RecN [Lachnospiraceae bacterium ZAX-1]